MQKLIINRELVTAMLIYKEQNLCLIIAKKKNKINYNEEKISIPYSNESCFYAHSVPSWN